MKTLLTLTLIIIFQGTSVLMAQDKNTDNEAALEVYYFHGTKRCPTCLAIEEETRKTLEESYKDDIQKGSLVCA